ncbi:MAG TPA: hypothetical protein VGM91_00765 [Conexibacter sp.]|jgi:hypothetical protein
MEARTVEGTGGGDQRAEVRERRRKGAWLRGSGRATAAGHRDAQELEAELALLREENAQLKLRLHRIDDRPLGERMRELGGFGTAPAGADEQATWELLAECQLLRGTLVEACRDVELAMVEMQRRLEALAPSGASDGVVVPAGTAMEAVDAREPV